MTNLPAYGPEPQVRCWSPKHEADRKSRSTESPADTPSLVASSANPPKSSSPSNKLGNYSNRPVPESQFAFLASSAKQGFSLSYSGSAFTGYRLIASLLRIADRTSVHRASKSFDAGNTGCHWNAYFGRRTDPKPTCFGPSSADVCEAHWLDA